MISRSNLRRVIVVLLCIFMMSLLFQNASAEGDVVLPAGKILYVGSNSQYKVIQEAVDAAEERDTIIIRSKFFKENPQAYYENITINKSNITIKGEHSSTTIIDGTNAGNTITFNNCSDVTLSNISIIGGTNGICLSNSDDNIFDSCNINNNLEDGVYFYSGSKNNQIISCNIENNKYSGISCGKYGTGAGEGTIIKNCRINSNSEGIFSDWRGNWTVFPIKSLTISGCDINTNKYYGIRAGYAVDWVVENNKVYNNGIGIEVRMSSDLSNNILFKGNEIYKNINSGLYLDNTHTNSKCKITYNKFEENGGNGITIGVSKNNTIQNNDFIKNKNCGIVCEVDSAYNFIDSNNFIENTQSNAEDKGNNNLWDNRESVGNYWSDYKGMDQNGDGIGEIPYLISKSDKAKDELPSIKPITRGFKIYGYVKSDFNSTNSELLKGFKVQIDNSALSTISDDTGYFVIENIPQNITNYNISISKDGYLIRIIESIAVTNDITLSTKEKSLEMWAGDVKIKGSQDSVINMSDVIQMAQTYNAVKGDANYNLSCDFNIDGTINMADVIIMAKHFNATSADYNKVQLQ